MDAITAVWRLGASVVIWMTGSTIDLTKAFLKGAWDAINPWFPYCTYMKWVLRRTSMVLTFHSSADVAKDVKTCVVLNLGLFIVCCRRIIILST